MPDQRYIFVGMPVGKTMGQMPISVAALNQSEAMLATLGIKLELQHWQGGALDTSRNMLVACFLRSPATDLVFIDSDLGFAPGDFLRLINHPVELAAVLYRMPNDPESYVVNHVGKMPTRDPATGLIEVDSMGLGFSRMKRAAVERMVARYAHRKYLPNYAWGMDAWSLYSFEFSGGCDWGEDITFCRRWRDIGGQIWVDPDISVRHAGPKIYDGCYAAYLAAQAAKAGKAVPTQGAAADWDAGAGSLHPPRRSSLLLPQAASAAKDDKAAPESAAAGLIAKIDATLAQMPKLDPIKVAA